MLQRRRKVKQIQLPGDTLQRIMEIGRFFGIVQNKQMIQGVKSGVIEHRGRNKLRNTALQIFEKELLGSGKRKPVRQLKQAGILQKTLQQRIHIHSAQRYNLHFQFNNRWNQLFLILRLMINFELIQLSQT